MSEIYAVCSALTGHPACRPPVVHLWAQGPRHDGGHRLLLLPGHHPPGSQGKPPCWCSAKNARCMIPHATRNILGMKGKWVIVKAPCKRPLAVPCCSPPRQGLERGECEAAASVGVNLTLVHSWTCACLRAGMLSEVGRCRALDSGAGAAAAGCQPGRAGRSCLGVHVWPLHKAGGPDSACTLASQCNNQDILTLCPAMCRWLCARRGGGSRHAGPPRPHLRPHCPVPAAVGGHGRQPGRPQQQPDRAQRPQPAGGGACGAADARHRWAGAWGWAARACTEECRCYTL